LTIGGGTPGGRSAIVNESIFSEPIINWPATPTTANTRNLRGVQVLRTRIEP